MTDDSAERQADSEFVDLLASIRAGACTPAAATALQRRCARPLDASDGIQPTKARRANPALSWGAPAHAAVPARVSRAATETKRQSCASRAGRVGPHDREVTDACAPPSAATPGSRCWEACAGGCTCL